MFENNAPPAFALPAALLQAGYALREERESDIPFLARLYASTREEELALAPWTAAEKEAFLLQQFDAQRRYYRATYPTTAFMALECGGEPVGRLYVERRSGSLHILDIALMPQSRGRGVGTAILQALIEFAQRDERSVGIFVEKFNPALSLYRRLGFAEINDHGVYFEMERPLADASA